MRGEREERHRGYRLRKRARDPSERSIAADFCIRVCLLEEFSLASEMYQLRQRDRGEE